MQLMKFVNFDVSFIRFVDQVLRELFGVYYNDVLEAGSCGDVHKKPFNFI